MRIIGTVEHVEHVEHVESGDVERTEVDAANYRAGVDAMRRTLPEGYRLLRICVDH